MRRKLGDSYVCDVGFEYYKKGVNCPKILTRTRTRTEWLTGSVNVLLVEATFYDAPLLFLEPLGPVQVAAKAGSPILAREFHCRRT